MTKPRLVRKFLVELKPGDQVYGTVIWNTSLTRPKDIPFTWGCPWTLTSIELSRKVNEGTVNEYHVFKVHIESSPPVNRNSLPMHDYEGFLVAEDNEP